MFKRVLLASDGTYEGLVAPREGAILAKQSGAAVFLLIVDTTSAAQIASGILPVTHDNPSQDLLDRGLDRLRALGIQATGVVAQGEAVQVISQQAKSWNAELVVLRHRRQSLLERWWSGAHGAFLIDHIDCSVLTARQVVSDDDFPSTAAGCRLQALLTQALLTQRPDHRVYKGAKLGRGLTVRMGEQL